MRFVHAAVLLAVSASPALAQRGPVIVIPGRPDVPILENGVDISWSVVEGEFGLDRPGQVTPTVIYRLPPPVIPTYAGAAATEPGYFPQDGRTPGYGRLEIVPATKSPATASGPELPQILVERIRADPGRSAVKQPPDVHLAGHRADFHRPAGPAWPVARPWTSGVGPGVGPGFGRR